MEKSEIKRTLIGMAVVYVALLAVIVLAAGCKITRIQDDELVTEKISVPVIEEVAEPIVEPVEETINESLGEGTVEDVTGAVVDAAPELVEAAPEVIEDAKSGNWTGVLLGIGGFLSAVWAGLVARRRIRRRRKGGKR